MKPTTLLLRIKILISCLFLLTLQTYLCAQDETRSGKMDLFTGPFWKIFQPGDNLFIYPTGMEEDSIQKRVFDLATGYMSTFNPQMHPMSDTASLDEELSKFNIFTAGNPDNNIWLQENSRYLQFSITDHSITTDTVYYGDDMVLVHCQPNPFNPEKGLFIFGLQEHSNMDYLDRGEQSWLIADWSITDSSGTFAADYFEKRKGNWTYKKIGADKVSDAKWIWYPGDFAIELNRRTALLRKERNEFYPPLWRLDAPYGLVIFTKNIRLNQPDTLSIYADGEFTVETGNGRMYDFNPKMLPLGPGLHTLCIKVANFDGLPALYVKGNSVVSDTTWRVALDWKGERRVPGSWYFDDPTEPPGKFRLKEKEIRPVSVVHTDTSIFADFGQETFGRLILESVKGEGKVLVIYGESLEEASAGKVAETWEIRTISIPVTSNDTLPVPMGFRYVNLIPSGDVTIQNVSHLYEYLPVKTRGAFECSDPVLNRIYKASARTLELNTREVMTDGIKRDRWAWAGDIFIGLLCNYYYFFEEDVIRRSQVALRGHDPVINHINTIPGYSFYWFINMYNHYFYTADTIFIRENYDKMKSMMEFCLDQREENGFYSIRYGKEWPWVDWANVPSKNVMSFDQILMLKSILIMEEFAEMLCKKDDADHFQAIASDLREKIWKHFWNEDLHGFIHFEVDTGKAPVTGYSNIYAIELGLVDKEQAYEITENIILNDSIPDVYIPFHKAFKASVLCRAGKHDLAVTGMRNFWKGMLDMGATSFWEHYDPELKGIEHYEHSNRKFCKSLCHAWSAGPLYIASRHIAGIQPLSPGYKSYLVEPNLCGLEWFRASIPVKGGMVNVSMDEKTIEIKSTISGGKCRFCSKKEPKLSCGLAEKVDIHLYEANLEKDQEYKIRYYW